jgi:putative glycerol-1-phosphate prenyltransferase
MKSQEILKQLIEGRISGRKFLAILIDPDDCEEQHHVDGMIRALEHSLVDFVFVGGSLISSKKFHEVIIQLKTKLQIPVIIFPGNNLQISNDADAILFLSLISGRNPEFLIGQQVTAAPVLKDSGLEIISTGYVLVGDENKSSVGYMSHTLPIPNSKNSIAVATSLAGQMLGMSLIYLEAGSGAGDAVPLAMIREVKKNINVPLIVGGGIKTSQMVKERFEAGADLIVIGNGFSENPQLLEDLKMVRQPRHELNVH